MLRHGAPLLAALCLTGCLASIDGDLSGPAAPDDPAPLPPRTTVPPAVADRQGAGPGLPGAASPADPGGVSPASDVGPAPMRRLTRFEHANTVRDLFGDGAAAAGLAADQEGHGTGFLTGGALSAVDVHQLIDAAEKVAASAIRRLPALLPCGAVPTGTTQQDQCARDFVAKMGKRVYRRPLSAAEQGELVALYARARTELRHEFPDAIRMVIEAMLLSPSFNFRWELGPNPAVKEGPLVRFNDFEIASRLSYFLWGSTPDDALLEAAEAGRLRTAQEVEAQARRLLAAPRARDMLADFHEQWLGVTTLLDKTKNARLFPAYSTRVAQSMLAEAREFAALVFGGDGRVETLLTAPVVLADAGLAKIYGQPAPAGTGLQRLSIPGQRAGIFTQGAFLATHATAAEPHPIKRGHQLAERLLCIDFPVPPPDIPEPRPAAPDLSGRERFAEHGKNECAIGCHALIDPLGFAFEHYDAVGSYRTSDGGKPVDASGAVTLGGAARGFRNAPELLGHLAASEETRECLARQWFRYALRRRETPGDAASLALMKTALDRSGGDLRQLLVAATQTRSFFYRQPLPGEVTR